MSKEFQIEFTYQDIPYVGLVRQLDRNDQAWYTVQLESENQESNLEILLKPSTSDVDDWDFYCINGEEEEDASAFYDKDLLTEIGEAVEAHLLKEY
jgi:hypothetical protein